MLRVPSLAILILLTCCAFSTAQDVQIEVTPSSQTAGVEKTTYTITPRVTSDFSSSLILNASSPTIPGLQCKFSPEMINPPYDKPAKLTVVIVGAVTEGDHLIIVEAHNGPLSTLDTCVISVRGRIGWRVFTKENSPLPSNEVRSIMIDRNDVAWIGTDAGLTRFDGTEWKTYDRYNSNLINNGIDAITEDSSGGIYAALWEGLVEFKNGNWKTMLPHKVISVATDRNGDIWCSGEEGIYQYKGSELKVFTVDSDVLSNSWSMTFDKNNALWMSAWHDGAYISRFDGTYWTHINLAEFGTSMSNKCQIVTDLNGDVWAATSEGLIRFNGVQPTMYRNAETNENFPGRSPEAICFDNWGAAWIGSQQSFARFENNKWWNYEMFNSGLTGAAINDIAIDDKRTLWIATKQGLILFDGSLPPDRMPTSVEEDTAKPATAIITSVSPHPISALTSVHLNLAEDTRVRMALYNSRGSEVVVLCDQAFAKGERIVQFDATGIAIGAYVLRLVAGDIVETKAVIVSR